MTFFDYDGAPALHQEPELDAPLGDLAPAEPLQHCFDVMECDMCPRFPCDDYMIYN